MDVIADTSALIYPAKNPSFTRILKQLFKAIYIPPSVHEEAITHGKELGKQDAVKLEKLSEEGFLILKPLENTAENIKKDLQKTGNLGNGEIEAISLAKQLRIERILIDDKLASEAARIHGLKPIPTTYILIMAIGKGIINLKIGLEILNQMISDGYHLSAEDYVAVKTTMEKVRKRL